MYEGVSKSFRTESITKYKLTTINTREATQRVNGGKTHYADSQNNDITLPSGRELYHLQFSLQAASPETFGYTLVHWRRISGLTFADQYHNLTPDVVLQCLAFGHRTNPLTFHGLPLSHNIRRPAQLPFTHFQHFTGSFT
jgi:hypothetical protein